MRLSIITINYNNAAGLESTIKSVLSQTCYDQIEYIIIDDGSTDGSVEVVKKYEDKLAFWTTRPNKGIYATMNEGVSHVSGDYCVFLNSGDTYHSNDCVSKILPNLGVSDFVIGRLQFNDSGTLTPIGQELTFKYFYTSCIPQNTSFVKTKLLRKYPFDEKYRIVSDVKFFIQALILGNASYSYVDEIIADYDCGGISSRNRNLCLMEREKVYNELFPERILADYVHFIKGDGYQNTDYDKFFLRLRDFKYSKVIYSLDVVLMKIVAVFRKGARFAKDFPVKLK